MFRCSVSFLRVVNRRGNPVDIYKPTGPYESCMYAFTILGDGAEDALERLLPALNGRVGVVRTGSTTASDGGVTRTRAVQADTVYTLEETWSAAGDDLTIEDALDRLAIDHDYAAVVGTPVTRTPTIVVGDAAVDDVTVIDEIDDATSFDPEAVVAAIDETEPHETLESLVAAVKRSPNAERSGAIATFTGRVRAKEHPDDERTQYLEFEKYDGVADRRMRTIESELTEREGVLDVKLHHRTGRIDDGEDIVFVVVLAGHRDEAFRTVEDGINRLKDEVPLFKKEVTESETFWVHERE